MKSMTIKLHETKCYKETPEERAERIRMWRTTATRAVPDKTKYNRKKTKRLVEVW